MAGIEITDEMTSEQLEAMTGGEQLKAEVYTADLGFSKSLLSKVCMHTWTNHSVCDSVIRAAILAKSGTLRSHHSVWRMHC